MHLSPLFILCQWNLLCYYPTWMRHVQIYEKSSFSMNNLNIYLIRSSNFFINILCVLNTRKKISTSNKQMYWNSYSNFSQIIQLSTILASRKFTELSSICRILQKMRDIVQACAWRIMLENGRHSLNTQLIYKLITKRFQS